MLGARLRFRLGIHVLTGDILRPIHNAARHIPCAFSKLSTVGAWIVFVIRLSIFHRLAPSFARRTLSQTNGFRLKPCSGLSFGYAQFQWLLSHLFLLFFPPFR